MASRKYEDFEKVRLLKKTMIYSLLLATREGKQYVLKIYRKKELADHGLSGKIKKEATLMNLVCSPFICKLHSTFQDHRRLFFELDYCHGGSLADRLQEWYLCPNDVALFYVAEVLEALDALHAQNIVYRNLSPENILIDSNGHIKLYDFTNAKKMQLDRTYTMVAFQSYSAPEQLLGNGHTKLADWWTFGILIFHLLTGTVPFEASDPIEAYFSMIQTNYTLPNYLDSDAAELIRKLICPDPRKRLGFGDQGCKKVKQQGWFEGVDFKAVANKKIPPPWRPSQNEHYYKCNDDEEDTSEDVEQIDIVDFII
mmetsp:Transcript_8697/g.16988  ORF Transcript_8697/g.16988 Transcript_8697/m.16988 type:complete len:312 (+) Transcript_8697:1270-2205(+)